LIIEYLKAIKGTHSTGKSVMTATKCAAFEQVILVDEQDREIGLAEKLSAHQQNLLHRAFSVFVFRQSPSLVLELLLQQRAFHKYHSGGLWTNTCCSHPRSGESVVRAGERRLKEELGFATSLRHLGWFQYSARFTNGLFENEIDHVLVGLVPADIKIIPNEEEVHTYRWITLATLHQELTTHPEKFTPWLAKALALAAKV
jgi:isopentenyl-diphosphate delta-isomerase type 1